MSVTEWSEVFRTIEEMNRCPECGKDWGKMLMRRITEGSGETHKEYKIVCGSCSYKTQPHRSRRLTIQEWNTEREK